MLKVCFSLPKLLYFLRTTVHFEYSAGSARWDGWSWGFIRISISTSRLSGLSFCCEWLYHDSFLGNIRRCFVYKSALSLTNEQESPLDGTQKNWTQPVYVKTAQELISRMDDKRSKVFNAHQGKFGSQWLNVAPCKSLGLKFDDQRFRISIGLRLGANICVAHTCRCGKRVERDGLHGLSCRKSAGRFSHAALIKQTLGSLNCLLCSNRVDCTELMANAETVLPWFLGKWVNSWCGMSRFWMLLHPVARMMTLNATR